MIESLQKKIEVLSGIEAKNDEQTSILKAEPTDWDAFDKNADEKVELIRQMEELDKGFDQIFDKIKEELQSPAGKAQYGAQIKTMQELIKQITEKSVSIQATEARNKQLVEKCFTISHQRIGQSRNTSRVARDYYKNMQQTQIVAPAFLDSKK